KRPYATIYGPDPNLPKGPNGQLARYQQNGMYFDQAGNYISGKYEPADAEDIKRDLAEENARLKAELEALKKGQTDEPQPLNRDKIVAQLNELNVKFDGRSSTEKLYELLQ